MEITESGDSDTGWQVDGEPREKFLRLHRTKKG
jgi:hypothetical protein